MNVKDILNRIETELKLLGMTKEEFYDKSGISSATFSHWNTEKFNPSVKKLKSAANVLGLTYEYLVTGEGQKKSPPPEAESEHNIKEAIFKNLELIAKTGTDKDLLEVQAKITSILMQREN